MTDKQLLEQALAFIEKTSTYLPTSFDEEGLSIHAAIRARLEQPAPVQEPDDVEIAAEQSDNYAAFHAGVRFARTHTTPPAAQRQWVGLNNSERLSIWEKAMLEDNGKNASLQNQPFVHYARAIEAKLKEKNAAQPAPVQDVDWKDMYEKEKRRSEMWIAKYEKDIGPLEKAVPAAPVQAPALVVYEGEIAKSNLPKGFTGMLYTHPTSAAPVQDGRDWSLLEATQESLREHMAEIQQLKAQREWVGLTDEELKSVTRLEDTKSHAELDLGKTFWVGARWAEAKLKEKNT